VHFVVRRVRSRDRKECAGTDMKGDRLAFNAAFAKASKKLRREVKSCRWRGDRTIGLRDTFAKEVGKG